MSQQRDKAIERILRRGAAAPPQSTSVDCLDAELLAAWTEHALSNTEAARVEEHVSGCGRCQAMIAVLARTTPPPVVVEPWWGRLQVRWLVPIATAVVVATVWIALPEKSPDTSSQVVVSRDVRVPQETPRPQPEASRPIPLPDRPSSPSSERSVAPAQDRLASGPPREDSRPARAPAKKELAEVTPEDARQPVPGARSSDQIARQRAEAVAELRMAAPPTAPAPSPQAAAATPPPPPATPVPSAGRAAPSTAPPATAAESVIVSGTTSLARAPAANIVSRSVGVEWRIVGGRQLQRSRNSGVEWHTIDFAPDAALTAGHSPTANVLWLVGEGGTIYVTVDGAKFERVSFVDTSDLVTVSALSAQQATVRTRDGRSFRTADGGRTWVLQ